MFGKILYISDNTAFIENKMDVSANVDLLNLHLIFEHNGHRILGEIVEINFDKIEINLLGEFDQNGHYSNGILTKRELGYIEYITEQVGIITDDFFERCNIELIDYKIEFGRLPNGRIVVIDEISPDTCRLLDIESGRCLDKDRFRKDMGDVSETYDEVSQRVLKLCRK